MFNIFSCKDENIGRFSLKFTFKVYIKQLTIFAKKLHRLHFDVFIGHFEHIPYHFFLMFLLPTLSIYLFALKNFVSIIFWQILQCFQVAVLWDIYTQPGETPAMKLFCSKIVNN